MYAFLIVPIFVRCVSRTKQHCGVRNPL